MHYNIVDKYPKCTDMSKKLGFTVKLQSIWINAIPMDSTLLKLEIRFCILHHKYILLYETSKYCDIIK